LAMSRPIVVIVCMGSSSESWEPYQRPHSWHSRAGGGAVHSIKSRLMHRSKQHLYSITSSARVSMVAGMSMRSDFAVLRLIMRWNFVGSITGNSDGFSPFTIRPA
jgi:hypothetical protein